MLDQPHACAFDPQRRCQPNAGFPIRSTQANDDADTLDRQ
jgi:hypothetical protein